MRLIIAEKEIAGAKIAEILSGGKVAKALLEGAPLYRFSEGKEETVVFPLRGHIVDVDFPSHYSSWLGTDVKKLVDVDPLYIEKEKRIIAGLKNIAKEANDVIIATDADREGEAIGVEAIDIIKKQNPKAKFKRAIFSAMTPKDLGDSFSKLEEVDYNLADSANSRREIDLVWGAALTRFLSLISGRLGKDYLSVGRVQTPVLALIVSKEKERLAFKSRKYWQIAAVFEKDAMKFEAGHKEGNFWDEKKAQDAFSKKADHGTVTGVKKKEKTIKRPVPFNTTEFLRAATAIGFSAHDAMSNAEFLYQSGYTSYPRTDNQVYPSTLDLRQIINELCRNEALAKDAKKIAALKTLSPSAGKMSKDHPPVHPVSNCPSGKVSPKQWKIYELIARRFLATLADDAVVNSTTVDIDLAKEPFVANGQTIIKAGWKEFYPYSKLEETILPELKERDKVKLVSHDLLQKDTTPPARYSQSALIKLMEDLGLGTKATRAEIIQKLYLRQYISGAKSIEPNNISFAIIDSLQKDAETITKPDMTSELEKEMDLIAMGKKKKAEIVNESRGLLRQVVNELSEKKFTIASNIKRALMQDSLLGKCLKCGNDFRILVSKNKKRFAACSGYPACRNTFPLPQKGKIIHENKTCKDCGNPMIKVLGTRYRFEMCLDPTCKSKEGWGKKKEAGNKKFEKPKEEDTNEKEDEPEQIEDVVEEKPEQN